MTIEGFWSRTERADSGCLLWTGRRDRDGYGQLKHRLNGEQYVHRVAWSLSHGPIPRGKKALHHCDVRNCVEATHLYLGSPADNIRDCRLRGRSPKALGERNSQTKLSESDVRKIRTARGRVPRRVLANRYHVSPTTIWNVWTRVVWQWVQ